MRGHSVATHRGNGAWSIPGAWPQWEFALSEFRDSFPGNTPKGLLTTQRATNGFIAAIPGRTNVSCVPGDTDKGGSINLKI